MRLLQADEQLKKPAAKAVPKAAATSSAPPVSKTTDAPPVPKTTEKHRAYSKAYHKEKTRLLRTTALPEDELKQMSRRAGQVAVEHLQRG